MESKKIIKWCLEHQMFHEEIEGPIDDINTEKPLSFLLVWSIWEQKLVKESYRGYEISKLVEDNKPNYKKFKIETQIKAFHKRYQDNSKWKNLIHKAKKTESYHEIVKKDFSSLTDSEKLTLGIFVVIRYRNNIFHGNKASFDWAKYSEPITMCYEIMMNMLDALREDNLEQLKSISS